MSRRVRYRNNWGRLGGYRYAGGRPGVPAKWAVITLMVLAGLVVIASVIR